MDTREKIVSREGLHEIIEEHRHSGRKIVFANGVFDLLHVGHVRYLQAARSEGDLLVVGINSDASTRKLKGEGRPVLTERARASLVAALKSVDYVVIFDELDVNPREIAALLGIRIAIVGDPKDHSTRGLLARLRQSDDAHDAQGK
jgi:rfaE bifunctional protein nucleotidyltransferase chain/domain